MKANEKVETIWFFSRFLPRQREMCEEFSNFFYKDKVLAAVVWNSSLELIERSLMEGSATLE